MLLLDNGMMVRCRTSVSILVILVESCLFRICYYFVIGGLSCHRFLFTTCSVRGVIW